MSHQVLISDEAFQALVSIATERNQTPEEVIESWAIGQQRDPYQEPIYQSFDEFFGELGMPPSEIQQAKDDAHI